MKAYAYEDGILALKPERQEACKAAGVTILAFGQSMPDNGILIADTRPRGFVGGRGPDDPAATMVYVGNAFKHSKKFYFESFDSALKKAIKLCGSV